MELSLRVMCVPLIVSLFLFRNNLGVCPIAKLEHIISSPFSIFYFSTYFNHLVTYSLQTSYMNSLRLYIKNLKYLTFPQILLQAARKYVTCFSFFFLAEQQVKNICMSFWCSDKFNKAHQKWLSFKKKNSFQSVYHQVRL